MPIPSIFLPTNERHDLHLITENGRLSNICLALKVMLGYIMMFQHDFCSLNIDKQYRDMNLLVLYV